jgi:hypothetical protein
MRSKQRYKALQLDESDGGGYDQLSLLKSGFEFKPRLPWIVMPSPLFRMTIFKPTTICDSQHRPWF